MPINIYENCIGKHSQTEHTAPSLLSSPLQRKPHPYLSSSQSFVGNTTLEHEV
jgi:hypothetical protein